MMNMMMMQGTNKHGLSQAIHGLDMIDDEHANSLDDSGLAAEDFAPRDRPDSPDFNRPPHELDGSPFEGQASNYDLTVSSNTAVPQQVLSQRGDV